MVAPDAADVSKLRQGRIVWAWMRDTQGRNPKRRTGVIITPTDEISQTDPFVVAAITSTFKEPLAEDEIRLPWNRDPAKVRTGLTTPVVVKCSWLVAITADDIEAVAGVVPDEVLRDILNRVSRLPG